jgi:hypothetical protein
MPVGRRLIFSLFLITGMTAANAAPNIPPDEVAGRERERFIPSPVDRFIHAGTRRRPHGSRGR